jgi:hypothetical protein
MLLKAALQILLRNIWQAPYLSSIVDWEENKEKDLILIRTVQYFFIMIRTALHFLLRKKQILAPFLINIREQKNKNRSRRLI